MTAYTASLPMYNFPAMADRNTAFWRALSEELELDQPSLVPAKLTSDRPAVPNAIGPEVLFSQTCGYPLQTLFRGQFNLLGVPTYDFPGCGPALHRAFIIVHRDSGYQSIDDLRGSRFALNSRQSNSGMNLPRVMLARRGISARFFGSVVETGSHTESIKQVVEGRLDAASIDCVTYGFFRECYADTAGALRVLDETPESPAIPFVTSITTQPQWIAALRTAVLRLAHTPRHKDALGGLHIKTIAATDMSFYGKIMDYEREAADRGYPILV